MIRTRRQWLQAAAFWPACLVLRAARKEFWEVKDPATWTSQEKQALLGDSPWARAGAVQMQVENKKSERRRITQSPQLPSAGPATPPGGVRSVPIGEKPPPPPDPNAGRPLEFRVLARWETAKPVRLAGGPEVPEMTGRYYVIRLRGLPLMPPPKAEPGETPVDPNEATLAALKEGSLLEPKDRPAIPCEHLFSGSGKAANDVLLFFPRPKRPITAADKQVTLECRFAPFQLEIKFPLKDMVFQGELAL